MKPFKRLIVFDGRVAVRAEICQDHARGLQGHSPLTPHTGMVFDYQSRYAHFHMGSVSFPIDIVFVSRGRVASIVHNIPPGCPDTWGNKMTDRVVELPGGFCAQAGIKVGDTALEGDEVFQSVFDERVPRSFRQPFMLGLQYYLEGYRLPDVGVALGGEGYSEKEITLILSALSKFDVYADAAFPRMPVEYDVKTELGVRRWV